MRSINNFFFVSVSHSTPEVLWFLTRCCWHAEESCSKPQICGRLLARERRGNLLVVVVLVLDLVVLIVDFVVVVV